MATTTRSVAARRAWHALADIALGDFDPACSGASAVLPPNSRAEVPPCLRSERHPPASPGSVEAG